MKDMENNRVARAAETLVWSLLETARQPVGSAALPSVRHSTKLSGLVRSQSSGRIVAIASHQSTPSNAIAFTQSFIGLLSSLAVVAIIIAIIIIPIVIITIVIITIVIITIVVITIVVITIVVVVVEGEILGLDIELDTPTPHVVGVGTFDFVFEDRRRLGIVDDLDGLAAQSGFLTMTLRFGPR